jgi:hypothetical protein
LGSIERTIRFRFAYVIKAMIEIISIQSLMSEWEKGNPSKEKNLGQSGI